MSPAVCEVDDCGVIAKLRCNTCNIALCDGHEAKNAPFRLGLCVTCKRAERASQEEAKAANERLESTRLEKAIERLRASGVATERQVRVEFVTRRNFLGIKKVKRVDTPFGPSLWPIGTLTFNQRETQRRGQRGEYPAGISASGDVYPLGWVVDVHDVNASASQIVQAVERAIRSTSR